MSKMRAKMELVSVNRTASGEQLKFSAVTNGTPEDNTYSKYTPSANLEMSVTNESLFGKFNPGEKYYVDFTPAEDKAS